MRFPWQRYYIKDVPQDELVQLFDENYWMGRTSDYDCGYLIHPPWRLEYFKRLAREILERRPTSVLEVGCARGDILKCVKQSSIPVAGIDISPWAIKHRVVDEVYLGKAQEIPFPSQSFDLYFSHDVLEHIPVQDIPKVVLEMRRVSRRAYIIISCGSFPDDIDATHVTMMPLSWWQKQLGNGFPLELVEKEGNTRWNWPTIKRMWRRVWLP